MPPKRQTSQSKINQDDDSIDKAKQEAEARRRKIDEERMARLANEKKVREAEEKVKKEQEESIRKKKEEEERIKKEKEEEEKRRQQEEEEVRRAAEERKKKMEADRRKQLEEQALRAEEERRKLEEERRKQEEDQQKLIDETKKSEPVLHIAASTHVQPTYDLLGGSVGEMSENNEDDHNNEEIYSNYTNDLYSVDSYAPHRQSEQRGPLDASVDEKLDSVHSTVSITKSGKNDGVYLFGTRMMKTKLGKDYNDPRVIIGSTLMPIEQFVRKFERVESVKLRGIMSAGPIIQFLTSKSKA